MVDHQTLQHVLVVGNGKGGVGKTSLAANIAGIAAAANHRVLVIDLDPQGNMGEDLGYTWDRQSDNGDGLVRTLLAGDPLQPTITGVRDRLDVVCGGEGLDDIDGALVARHRNGRDTTNLLTVSLAPMAANYDLVVIDSPPGNQGLQMLALAAARWVLIPTKPDASSILGLSKIARRIADARTTNPGLDIAGVVLFDMTTSATAIRAKTEGQVREALGGIAPLFDTAIRHSLAVANEARNSGRLVHEIAAAAGAAEPWYAALREGRRPERMPGSAQAVADDYVVVTQELLLRMAGRAEDTEPIPAMEATP